MITLTQYFGNKPHPAQHEANAIKLLARVNCLLDIAKQGGCYEDWVDPDTGSQISGSRGGSGDGGYRTPNSKTGTQTSSHREAMGVDVYDPHRKLAQWCVKNRARLGQMELYCEDFRWTPTWCHFQTRPTKFRIYIPYSDIKKYPPLAPALEGQAPLPFVIKT